MYVAVILRFGLVTGILYGFGRDIEKVLVTLLYSFAIIYITIVGLAEILGKQLVTGIIYGFNIYDGDICYNVFLTFK